MQYRINKEHRGLAAVFFVTLLTDVFAFARLSGD
jgi:hypothetical protein